MRALAVASFVAGGSLALWGCGGGEGGDTTAAPSPPYDASTVQKAWDNHLAAFLAFDVPRILKDYDETSMITTFNEACFVNNQAKPKGYKMYKGTEQIKTFFNNLFEQLDDINNVKHIGPSGIDAQGENGGPVVLEPPAGGTVADANVFLTWRAVNATAEITFATDTFSFKKTGDNFVINLQTIVTTEPTGACTETTQKPATTEPIQAAWINHFSAFGQKDNLTIMDDYTESSIVQVYDNTNLNLETFTGLTQIQGMFNDLFAAIAAANDNVQVGLVEVEPDYSSVFLAWKSNSHPKATDTFIFNGNKIARQNIVVSTPSSVVAEAPQSELAVVV